MDSIFTLLSSLKSQQRQLDSISNNLANVNTPGYKQDTAVFREMFTEYSTQDLESEQELFAHDEFISPLGRGGTSFVAPDHVSPQMHTGKMMPTDNPFDIALQTKGFFSIETPQGERYTRNGRFLINAESILINNNGDKVLGENGPIKVNGKDFAVAQDGSVIVDGQTIDRLKIVNFEEPSRLTKLGNSYWAPGSDKQMPIPSTDFGLQQGMYEGSNVDTVTEMVSMINVNRSYEAAQKAMRSNDDMDESSITIARI